MATKTPTKDKKNEKEKKGKLESMGMRMPQLRILECLAKSNKPLSRAQIAEKAGVDVACMTSWVGSHDTATRLANDEKHFPSLISLGFLKAEEHDVDGKDVVLHTITAKGKAAMAKAKDYLAAKEKEKR